MICEDTLLPDYHSDFMSDETSHCRDGMSYCEPNTTYNTTAMNTSLYDEAVSIFWYRFAEKWIC